MYSCQQHLIDRIKAQVTDFAIVTNASLSPDDKTLAKKLPACTVSIMDNKNNDFPNSLSGDFQIIETALAITVIISHEADALAHEQTETIGGALMLKTLKAVLNYRPTGFNDSFSLIGVFSPAPVYFDEQGMAAFTRAVKICDVIIL
ncbi:MAG: hypothetical protein PHD53_00130 [Methylococcales bacterium]|nr:hypothetical protein [Methylococcales bacterium]